VCGDPWSVKRGVPVQVDNTYTGAYLATGDTDAGARARLSRWANVRILDVRNLLPGTLGGFTDANLAARVHDDAFALFADKTWCCSGEQPMEVRAGRTCAACTAARGAARGDDAVATMPWLCTFYISPPASRPACSVQVQGPVLRVQVSHLEWAYQLPARLPVLASPMESVQVQPKALPAYVRPAFCDAIKDDKHNAQFLAFENHPCTFLAAGIAFPATVQELFA
jgi:hypothetical protein